MVLLRSQEEGGDHMRTQEMLEEMSTEQREYLESLKENIKRAKMVNQNSLVDEFRSMGKGYIKGLVDCGVIKDFKTAWCWFTL